MMLFAARKAQKACGIHWIPADFGGPFRDSSSAGSEAFMFMGDLQMTQRRHRDSRTVRVRRSPSRYLGLACALAIVVMAAFTADHAATYTVTTTADLPGPTCGIPCSLRQAIAAANGAGGTNVIAFAINGTFSLTTATELRVTASPSQTLTLLGNGSKNTVIDGGGTSRVLAIDSGAIVSLTGITITNGNAGPGGDGGGILNLGTLAVSDSDITGNSAGVSGGGISSSGTATLNITNSFITSNSAGVGGGGVRNGTGCTLTVTRCTLSDNSAGIVGGGVVSGGDSTLLITNSTLSGNSVSGAGGGGGIATQGQSIVSNCTITGNTAEDHGGGIAIGAAIGRLPGMLTLRNSVVSGNIVSGSGKANDGGGINNGSTLIVDHSFIIDNSARRDGGGIANEGGAITTVTRSTITGNSAGHDGGGITNEIAGSPPNAVTLTATTVSGNTARHVGGGIFNATGTVALSKSSIVQNTPDNCSPTGSVPGCID